MYSQEWQCDTSSRQNSQEWRHWCQGRGKGHSTLSDSSHMTKTSIQVVHRMKLICLYNGASLVYFRCWKRLDSWWIWTTSISLGWSVSWLCEEFYCYLMILLHYGMMYLYDIRYFNGCQVKEELYAHHFTICLDFVGICDADCVMLVLELAPKGPLNSFLKNNKWVNLTELYLMTSKCILICLLYPDLNTCNKPLCYIHELQWMNLESNL